MRNELPSTLWRFLLSIIQDRGVLPLTTASRGELCKLLTLLVLVVVIVDVVRSATRGGGGRKGAPSSKSWHERRETRKARRDIHREREREREREGLVAEREASG